MKFIGTVLLAVLAVAVGLAQAYTYNQLLAGIAPYVRHQSWVAQPLQSSGLSSLSGGRDPRSNTGPIQFPPGPPGNPADTSGVIVGASGYGFVPPNSDFWAYFFN
ncbi:uncharacterized protein LOC106638034 [Copidosoma floridanum]|uniref:uncharacterized protein LOC106638034 n=1 Tax=Copidosoma floridanum TaxID=29053 RepID=UPI0006C99D0E|nr:uncharacterized protein LOC106638034 [Copidosoma floridanum]